LTICLVLEWGVHLELWPHALPQGLSKLVTHPQILDGLNYKSKSEDNERRKSWGMLWLTTLWGYMGMLELRDETRKNENHLITHTDLHKPNNKLVSA
jgi:hypothetical protein